MFSYNRSVLALISLAAASMVACGEPTGPLPDVSGTFSAKVTGDAARTFAGRAVFTSDVPGPEYGFAVALIDSIPSGGEPGVRHAVYLYREDGGVPTVGDHAVGAQESIQGGVVLDGDGNNPFFCVAESGTVRITSVNAASIRGSFEVEAACFHLGGEMVGDTVQVTGSFDALDGTISVPENVVETPGFSGRFDLHTAAGAPLPAVVFDGLVSVGNDEFARLEITVTEGYIEFDGSGAYEHRVTQEVRVDGQPAPALDWVDRGTCVDSGTELTCFSSLVVNRAFMAAHDNSALEVTQDLNGEGVVVPYRYVRGG